MDFLVAQKGQENAPSFLGWWRRTAFLGVVFFSFSVAPALVQAEISANFQGGAVILGTADTAPCDGTTEGALRWNSTDKLHEMCDGAGWRRMLAQGTGPGTPSIPVAGSGYFVVTAGIWNGDIKTAGGMGTPYASADALCLSDLTDNDWLGKDDAVANGQLTSGNVRSILCSYDWCPTHLMPNATYYFAVSGSPAAGGASFTTDATGRAPGNAQHWSGANYFNGSKEYWSHRSMDSDSDTLWQNTGWGYSYSCAPGGNSATMWTSSSGSLNGLIGGSNYNNRNRWRAGGASCDQLKHLVCFVNPL